MSSDVFRSLKLMINTQVLVMGQLASPVWWQHLTSS